MTESEAAAILKRMVDAAAPHRQTALAVHLFAIKYARELDGLSLRRIVDLSIPGSSWGTEIAKGRNLANYVEIVRSPQWL